LSAKDAIRKSVEADNPFLEHRLFSAQTEKNISSRKYMAQMGNVSGGKEMVEFTSSGAFHHEKCYWPITFLVMECARGDVFCHVRQNFLYCAKRRMPCFFSLYLLYWKTPGRGGKTSGELPVREALLPAYPAT
jgi:hypothetical protein